MMGESGMEEIPVKQGLYRNHGDRISCGMMYCIGGLEFERKKFFGMLEEILNNPAQQYKYFKFA